MTYLELNEIRTTMSAIKSDIREHNYAVGTYIKNRYARYLCYATNGGNPVSLKYAIMCTVSPCKDDCSVLSERWDLVYEDNILTSAYNNKPYNVMYKSISRSFSIMLTDQIKDLCDYQHLYCTLNDMYDLNAKAKDKAKDKAKSIEKDYDEIERG